VQTRLAALCDRLIETGWLAAILVIPIYFQALSSRVFEPDKIIAVRVIALVVAAAWAVKSLEAIRRPRQGPLTPAAETELALRRDPPGNWLVWPCLILLTALAIATAASVAPRQSFFGSYQRLQGTLSMLAYVVIGLSVAANLRTRAQLDRLITTLVLGSVPVALYGILQHLQRDPMPWSADVTFRVSSTMGNSIFVAAYLIMIAPPTLMRLIQAVRDWRASEDRRGESIPILIAFGAGLIQQIVFFQLMLRFGGTPGVWWTALPVVAAMLVLCLPFFYPMRSRRAAGVRVLGYSMVLAAQLAAILFSQSRGPEIGLIAGLVVVGLGLALLLLHRRGRLIVGGVTLAAGLLLAAINLPGGLHERVRSFPYVGRLATLLESEGGTGKIRLLIWSGTMELFLRHPAPGIEPDPLNAIRPLIGSGPETLFFTFNKVYPRDLAHLEARTSSPDRAHNETLQNLVEVGLLGTVAFWLFTNLILFHLLDATGLVPTASQRTVRLLVLPLGVFAVVGYLYVRAGTRSFRPERVEMAPALVALGLLGALVAHVVELQFGIGIAATRTYFFVFAGVAVALSIWQTAAKSHEAHLAAAAEEEHAESALARVPHEAETRAPTRATAAASARGRRARSAVSAGARATGRRALEGRAEERAPPRREGEIGPSRLWVPAAFVALTLLVTALGGSIPSLVDPWWPTAFAYGWLLLSMLTLAYALMEPGAARFWDPRNALFVLPLLAAVAIGLALLVAPAEADVEFKRSQDFSSNGQWPEAINSLQAAANLQQYEDYFFLNLGRAYRELARNAGNKPATSEVTSLDSVLNMRPEAIPHLGRDDALRASEAALLEAQRLAPLNTDHYANLGRLYRFWYDTGSPSRGEDAIAWYLRAIQMSPGSALLLDELAQAYASVRQYDAGLVYSQRAIQVDPEYVSGYRTTVDLYAQMNDWHSTLQWLQRTLKLGPDALNDPRLQGWLSGLAAAGKSDAVIQLYREEIARTPTPLAHSLYPPLGVALTRSGRPAEAIQAFETAVQIQPDDWISNRNLATLYADQNRLDEAIGALRRALQYAPKERTSELTARQQQLEQRRTGR
jgi:tetratricopeptide (TPR) repeat protein